MVCIIAATATVEGKMSKALKSLMKKVVGSDIQEELAVADAKLGNVIKVRHFMYMLYDFNVSSSNWGCDIRWFR